MKLLESLILHSLEKGVRPDLSDVLSRRIDTNVLSSVADDFAESFEGSMPTVVLTAEPCGIAIAAETAKRFGCAATYARKREEADAFSALVNSKTNTTLYLPKKYLSKKDRVLIVDDSIAMGGIATALVELVRQAGAELVGIGVALDRAYLGAGDRFRARGIRFRSVVSIASDDGGLGIVIEKQEKKRTV